MAGAPSGSTDERHQRLRNCIRDLAALNALPSMCVGRSPDEALAIIVDALPTALDCDLVYLVLPAPMASEHASFRGAELGDTELAELRAALAGEGSVQSTVTFAWTGPLWWVDADLPIGAERGRLVAARPTPLDPETDRVLVRSAANLVGATLEAAHVLDAARRKDEFLAMLGHELRNPLAPILTAVELLARHEPAAREQQIIERHTRHLARLVDDLLDISRVTHGLVELRSEPVSLASALDRAVELASPLVTRQHQRLHVGSAPEVTLQGDPVRLAQIFGNLLTNAAKFTPQFGTIEVSIEALGDRVRVAVRDNGRGITRDHLARIFEPFVQVDRDHGVRGGLGLGLAIVYSLVQRHGGTIKAHSDGPGRGAVFTVELPVVEWRPAAVAVPQTRPPLARTGIRVLIVDDNEDLAELLSLALDGVGFRTAVAYDAQDALATWRSFGPHAAVVDLGLPGIDGLELAKALRTEYGDGPTLIAATGYGQGSDRQRTMEAGFDCHFVKPVALHELVRALDDRVVERVGGTPP
jgi:signal transduction histidine kinase/CheY-like chemotaxis protein